VTSEEYKKSAAWLSRPMLYAGVGVGLVLVVLCLVYGVQSYFHPRSKGNDLAAAVKVFETTKTVEITDYDFKPKTGAVKFGDKVTWKNLGTQSHTVTFRFVSKTLYPGEEWSWTIGRDAFTKGENIYWCDLHRGKGMEGASLVVAE
jgi:plastocyanin